MKIPIALSALFLLGPLFQAPSTPPIKMGLWEITVTAKASGPGLPANMPEHVTTTRGCRTPSTYQTFFVGGMSGMCTRANEVWTGKSYKADVTCTGAHAAVAHIEVYFDSAEATHGSARVEITTPHPLHMESTSVGRYLGPDCGAIAPGKAVAVP